MRRSFRVAERIRRRVPALQSYLVWQQSLIEFDKELLVERDAACGVCIDLHHPAANAVRIELRIPGRVEGVGDVDSPAIATDFDHLRPAVQRTRGIARV